MLSSDSWMSNFTRRGKIEAISDIGTIRKDDAPIDKDRMGEVDEARSLILVGSGLDKKSSTKLISHIGRPGTSCFNQEDGAVILVRFGSDVGAML